jgi:hypothetical protein
MRVVALLFLLRIYCHLRPLFIHITILLTIIHGAAVILGFALLYPVSLLNTTVSGGNLLTLLLISETSGLFLDMAITMYNVHQLLRLGQARSMPTLMILVLKGRVL